MIFNKVRLGFIVCDTGIFFYLFFFCHLKDKLMCKRRFKLYSTHCKVPDLQGDYRVGSLRFQSIKNEWIK